MLSTVSNELALVCRKSRLLEQIVDAARRTRYDGQRTTHDGHCPITIAQHEHFVLR